MKKTVGFSLAVLCVFTFSAGADTLVASFDFGDEAIFNGFGPYAGESAPFTGVTPATGFIVTANGITLSLTNGAGFYSGINGTDPFDPIALFGDYYLELGGGDDQGNFMLTGLDTDQLYDIYIIAPNGTGYGADNVYGADYILGNGTADSTTVRATGGVDGLFTGWVEGRDFAVFYSAKADITGEFSGTFNRISGQPHTGIAGIQIVAIPEPATVGLFGIFGAGLFLAQRNLRIFRRERDL